MTTDLLEPSYNHMIVERDFNIEVLKKEHSNYKLTNQVIVSIVILCATGALLYFQYRKLNEAQEHRLKLRKISKN